MTSECHVSDIGLDCARRMTACANVCDNVLPQALCRQKLHHSLGILKLTESNIIKLKFIKYSNRRTNSSGVGVGVANSCVDNIAGGVAAVLMQHNGGGREGQMEEEVVKVVVEEATLRTIASR